MPRARRFGVTAALALLLGGVGRVAAAPADSAWLDVTRGVGADGCPSGEALRAQVVRELGRDPFDAGATLRFRCDFFRAAAGFGARLQSSDGEGSRPRTRPFTSRTRSCDDLAELVAFSLVVTLNDVASAQVARAAVPRMPQPDPEPEAAPVQSPTRLAPAAVPAPAPVASWFQAGTGLGFGVLPRAALGVAAGAGLSRGAWAALSELRLDSAFESTSAYGPVHASRVTLSVQPCWQAPPFGLCGVARGGVLSLAVDAETNPTSDSLLVVETGARAFRRATVLPGHSVEVSLEVIAPLTRLRLFWGTDPLWTAPALAAALAVSWIFDPSDS